MPDGAPQQLRLEVEQLEPRRRDAPGRREPDRAPTAAVGPPAKATTLLATPGALLTRSHLRELGLERRAVDAVFRALPIVALPGYSRPMIRAEQYRELVERFTYSDDRVRPMARS